MMPKKTIEQIDEEIKTLKKRKRKMQEEQRKAELERQENMWKELGKKTIEILELSEHEIPLFEEYLLSKKRSVRQSIDAKAPKIEENE